MTSEEIIKKVESEIIELADKALEQESCEDCISREATLAEFKRIYFDNETVIRCAELILGGMPPVTPNPKTDVLDKIRAEIHATAEMHEDGNYYLRDEWIDEIFDNYKAGSEE